jgi:hypothetical protein
MLPLDSQSKIVFFPKPVNFHKSFDSLNYLVHSELGLELVPNLFILFANPRKNRIKILFHNGQHLLLISTRFEYALHFSFEEGICFNEETFDKFINTINPRRRVKKIKNL